MSDGDRRVGVAGSATATVHAERVGSGEPRQEDQNDSRTFTPGQTVELAVQVGSWTEGMSAEIIGPSAAGSAYEWDVWVKREVGPMRVSLYEHEIRSTQQPSLIERLAARTDDEWLVGYKDWVVPTDNLSDFKPQGYFWAGTVVTDGQLDGEDPFGAAVDALYTESEALLHSKLADYGPYNVSRSPGGELMGLAVRLHDKVSRLANLLANDTDPNHESIRDTFLDVMGYGAIGVLVCDGNWPGD